MEQASGSIMTGTVYDVRSLLCPPASHFSITYYSNTILLLLWPSTALCLLLGEHRVSHFLDYVEDNNDGGPLCPV